MKYLKTKDTIFEVLEETDIIYKVRAKGNPDHSYSKSKSQTNVIALGETIEELCDKFIFVAPDGYKGFAYPSRLHTKGFYEDCTIYGAIWTKSGLTYVAKMTIDNEGTETPFELYVP